MTYAEAKKAVAGKLIFGDVAQIAARDWLRDFNQLKHAVMNCLGEHKSVPKYENAHATCACLNGLYSMTDERAMEMHRELRKYLEHRNEG